MPNNNGTDKNAIINMLKKVKENGYIERNVVKTSDCNFQKYVFEIKIPLDEITSTLDMTDKESREPQDLATAHTQN